MEPRAATGGLHPSTTSRARFATTSFPRSVSAIERSGSSAIRVDRADRRICAAVRDSARSSPLARNAACTRAGCAAPPSRKRPRVAARPRVHARSVPDAQGERRRRRGHALQRRSVPYRAVGRGQRRRGIPARGGRGVRSLPARGADRARRRHDGHRRWRRSRLLLAPGYRTRARGRPMHRPDDSIAARVSRALRADEADDGPGSRATP